MIATETNEGMITMTRTPEEGHTFQCLAKTMIAVIENHRDHLADAMTYQFAPITQSAADYDFRLWAQDNIALHTADEYLADGTSDCICPPFLTRADFTDIDALHSKGGS